MLAVAAIFAVLVGSPASCQTLARHGQADAAQACYQSLADDADPYLRAEGFWGLDLYSQANDQFRLAVAAADAQHDTARATLARIRWGRLLHDRFNDTDADNLFHEALKLDPKSADAYLGLALVSADGFDAQADESLDRALALDPKLVEACDLKASLALEDSDSPAALAAADRALALDPDDLDALAIHAASEVIALRPPDAWLAKIHAIDPHYGQAYATIAYQLVLNRRYDDATAYYRQAVAADPELWSAHSQLGINLMRLGQVDEPRQQLELAYSHDYRDAATVNTLRLLDSLDKFVTITQRGTQPAFILKLDPKEADLLAPYIEPELLGDIAAYSKKYAMTLPGPVQLEVYPNHDDFAVRTVGLPGLGALGVTFGEVVAIDSPSGRPPGEFNWADTLRHEMDHVFVLTATHHLAPRWFAEGLAVHEETEDNPEWGDRITPDILMAIAEKKLLPIAQLDKGFVRSDYPGQVQVSYYQAGRICDYIQSRWGAAKLVDMVHAFAVPTTTPAVLQQTLAITPDQFDLDFQAWLMKDIGSTVAHLDDWRAGLQALIAAQKAGDNAQVIAQAPKVIALYPDYVYDASAYELLSQAELAQGDKAAAAAALVQYQTRGGRNPASLKQLATLQADQGQTAAAAATLDAINAIDPVDADLHRQLGALDLELKNNPGAIREFTALAAMHPLDQAGAEFSLAQAYFNSGQLDPAQDHIITALAAAHDFKPAQQLLVQIMNAKAASH